jgi:hypothetical protein
MGLQIQLRNWAKLGIFIVGNLWSITEQDWKTAQQIWIGTNSRLLTATQQRNKVLHSIS